MIRPEWKKIETQFYGTQHVTKALVEICQEFHDQEIAALNAQHAAEIARLESEVERLLSPGLIVNNPYPDELRHIAYDNGYKDGQRSVTMPEEPQAYRNLTDIELRAVWDACPEITSICWDSDVFFGVRALIAADRKLNSAKQREVKPLPATVKGRWYEGVDKMAYFLHPKQYELHQRAIDQMPDDCRWLSLEKIYEFPNA